MVFGVLPTGRRAAAGERASGIMSLVTGRARGRTPAARRRFCQTILRGGELRHDREDTAGIAARKVRLEYRPRGFSPAAGRPWSPGQSKNGGLAEAPEARSRSRRQFDGRTRPRDDGGRLQGDGVAAEDRALGRAALCCAGGRPAGSACRLSEECSTGDGRRTQSGARGSGRLPESRATRDSG